MEAVSIFVIFKIKSGITNSSLYSSVRDSRISQFVQNLPVMQETLVLFLSREDLLQKG